MTRPTDLIQTDIVAREIRKSLNLSLTLVATTQCCIEDGMQRTVYNHDRLNKLSDCSSVLSGNPPEATSSTIHRRC